MDEHLDNHDDRKERAMQRLFDNLLKGIFGLMALVFMLALVLNYAAWIITFLVMVLVILVMLIIFQRQRNRN